MQSNIDLVLGKAPSASAVKSEWKRVVFTACLIMPE